LFKFEHRPLLLAPFFEVLLKSLPGEAPTTSRENTEFFVVQSCQLVLWLCLRILLELALQLYQEVMLQNIYVMKNGPSQKRNIRIYSVFRLTWKGFSSSSIFHLNGQIPVVGNPDKLHAGVAA
jgi:hypothetical protein